jgi:TPR repeat protein
MGDRRPAKQLSGCDEPAGESAIVRQARNPNWDHVIAGLRRGVAAGNAPAMTELAITINDGIRAPNGRILVRRNAPYAFRLLRRALESGDENAAGPLGYAYDIGQGTKRNVAQAIRWYRRAARSGDSTAMSNLATVYRDAGKVGLALQWWKRAADMRDDDAAVDVGYCYQYGIGTRKNTANAKRLFRRAIASKDISQYGREEAMYHLAVQFIDEGKLQLALPLLKRAATDDDFPEAASVLDQLNTNSDYVPCRCRRFINKRLRGNTKCSLHAR